MVHRPLFLFVNNGNLKQNLPIHLYRPNEKKPSSNYFMNAGPIKLERKKFLNHQLTFECRLHTCTTFSYTYTHNALQSLSIHGASIVLMPLGIMPIYQ